MKQILVIEDTAEARKKFWDDADAVACRGSMVSEEFYKIYSPGNLLAEFKGMVHKFDLSEIQSGDRQGIIISGVGLSEENYQTVTVLILEEK